MSVTVRPFRSGGWEVDLRLPASQRNAASRTSQGSGRVQDGGASVGRAKGTGAAAQWPAATKEGGSSTQRVCRAVHQLPRQGQSAEAERHRVEGVGLDVTWCRCLGSKTLDAITTEDVQRLKQRLEKKITEDGEQHPLGAQHAPRRRPSRGT